MNMEAPGPVFKALPGDNDCVSWVVTKALVGEGNL